MNAKGKSKNLIVAVLLIVIVLFSLLCGTSTTQTAHADMGPKSSVIVTVENLDGRVCYGTLLSYEKIYGPSAAYSPEDPYIPSPFDPESEYYDEAEHAIWKAFVEYADPDGYYYLQRHWKCNETGKISWTYMPPESFKILLYFPETQTFLSSGVCKGYAFHSYFTVNLSDTDFTVSQTELNVRKSYGYTWEIISLIVRIIATVLIEIGVAWLFELRSKKKIISVIILNVVTQTALNVVLNILAFFQNLWALIWYIPIELAIFIIEALAYIIIFSLTKAKTVKDGNATNPDYLSIGKCVAFSLVANLLSFTAGFLLALILPGFF